MLQTNVHGTLRHVHSSMASPIPGGSFKIIVQSSESGRKGMRLDSTLQGGGGENALLSSVSFVK